jgi:hypothetical protein
LQYSISYKCGLSGPLTWIFSLENSIILIFIVLIHAQLFSQDSIKQSTITLNGYISEMPNLQYNSMLDESEYSNQLHNRLNFKWQPNTNITAAMEFRTRFYYYGSDTNMTSYYKVFEQDAGVIGLSKNIISGENYLLNISIDRLWIDYSRNKWQFTLGRQRINWGQTFVWNPNDLFNTYNYLDFDYIEKPGSDALRVQYYTTETNKTELVIKADSSGKPTVAGLYRFNKWNYDIQFIAGFTSDDDVVLGGGWAGQLVKGGFRGEISYFMPKKEMFQGEGTVSASMGWDYMFKNSLFLQFECLYNGSKQDSSAFNIYENNAFRISAKSPFLSDFSYFTAVSYPITPLLNGSLSGILNPHNKVYILIPSFDFNILQNLDLSFLTQLIGFKAQQEKFSSISMWFFRVKYSF